MYIFKEVAKLHNISLYKGLIDLYKKLISCK